MGCDCYIYLPDNARLRDIQDVMGALMGYKKERSEFSGGWSAKVEGVKAEPSGAGTVEMCILTGKLPDGPAADARGEAGEGFMAFWHWEGHPGFRLLSVKSTKFWITVGKKLVDFFGGYVDYNDCDDKEKDYVKKVKTKNENSPEDGKPWVKFQERIMAVEPITTEEYNKNQKFAAYQ
jgi:hypothetical protein